MLDRRRLPLLLALVAALTTFGCDCSDPERRGDATVEGGAGDAEADLDADLDSSTSPGCAELDAPCGAGCCGGLVCGSGLCGLPSYVCAATGEDCAAGPDCCSNACDATGRCAASCTQLGNGCSSGIECCTGYCDGSSVCARVPNNGSVCAPTGESCDADGDCCTNHCSSGVCRSTGAACAPRGDSCYSDQDCCSFRCNLADPTATAGFCETLSVGGTASCSVAGEPCSATSCQGCCSRSCAPTATGTNVCSNVSGCRVDGDVCTDDDDCCGGPNSGFGSAGNGECKKNAPGDPYGRCQITSGPVGAVCSLVTPICGGVSSAPSNCSDCAASPKSQCCHLDTGGTPRCLASGAGECAAGYDGTAGCCIAAGSACSSSTECCNDAPCVRNPSTGGYECGSACADVGETCANTGDCCDGLACSVPSGALSGTCVVTTVDPPPVDGGVGDAGTGPVCAGYAQVCASQADCCEGMSLTCYDYAANGPCVVGGSTTCGCIVVLE